MTLARQLTEKYGRNFEERSLRRMFQFAEQFQDIEIVSTLSTQLSWLYFIELLPLQSSEARLFYAQQAAHGHLGVRDLRSLSFRAPGNNAAVIIGKHDHRLAQEIGPEKPLARGVKVVAVNERP